MDDYKPEDQQPGRPQPGKRLAPGTGLGAAGRRVILIFAVALTALTMTYLALCAYVTVSGAVLPRTVVSGVDLSGLSAEAAESQLAADLGARFETLHVSFTYPEGDGSVKGSSVGVDPASARAAWDYGRTHGFLAQGAYLVKNLVLGHELSATLVFQDPVSMDDMLRHISEKLTRPTTQTTWARADGALVFHMGISGRSFDPAAAKAQILAAFARADVEKRSREAGDPFPGPFALDYTAAPPAFPDLESIHREIYAVAADARLDPATKQIVPSVTGVEFNVATAKAVLEAAAEGSDCTVALQLTAPELSTDELTASLFRDVLGEAVSKVSGSANRKSNVKRSAQACNETILLPGDVFSYNTATGSRSADKGYLPAPAYVGGLSVDELGGGICQTSSTIYYAALNSNLKIVERKNHMYAVGYVPDGMDATVYFGSLDFRFENDTRYPIKIVTESYDVKGTRRLRVQMLGTKSNQNYVKMTCREISSIAPETIYKPDPTVPPGTSRPDPRSTAYRGRRVEAYRNIYGPDNQLISATLESVSNYKKRDRIILVNPDEIGNYGPDGLIVTPAPSLPPSPAPSPAPGSDLDPADPVSPSPQVSPVVPEGSEGSVEPSPLPAPTPAPAPTPTPAPDNGIPILTPPPVAVSVPPQ